MPRVSEDVGRPCRNISRDVEIWLEIVRISRTHHVWEVREGAQHALISLRERARIATRAAQLLLAIGAGAEQKRHEWLWTGGPIKYPKLVRNDVPTIIAMLASDDEREEQAVALQSLFRTDRHVASPVWREIERACVSTDQTLRAKAQRARRRIEAHREAEPRRGFAKPGALRQSDVNEEALADTLPS